MNSESRCLKYNETEENKSIIMSRNVHIHFDEWPDEKWVIKTNYYWIDTFLCKQLYGHAQIYSKWTSAKLFPNLKYEDVGGS